MSIGQQHPTAIVAPQATLGRDVQIGPYCIVGAEVTLSDGVILHSHAVVDGNTTIGTGTEIFPFASIGLRRRTRNFAAKNRSLSSASAPSSASM